MRFRYWMIGGIALSIAAACALDEVDFKNKQCPCGEGYVCDPVKAICVLPSEVTPVVVPNDAGEIGEGSVISCTGASCPCNVDTDCKEAGRSRCGPAKICVECLAANDNCTNSSYCNSENQCVPGCKSNADCQISPLSPKCNTASHQCVECVINPDCTGLKNLCSPSGICVTGCSLEAGVGCDGGECCDNLCLNTTTDKLNCGGCAIACSTVSNTPSCNNKTCSYSCASGTAHCQTGNTGCETPTRTATSCGSCGNLKNCTQLVQNANVVQCTGGNCNYSTCQTGFFDEDGNRENGCEARCGNFGEPCCPGSVCLNGTQCKPPNPPTCK